MRNILVLTSLIMALAILSPATSTAQQLKNSSFETDFGSKEDENMWGDHGIAFGEAYVANADTEGHPKRAHSGDRMLLINAPSGTWNGVWQEVNWGSEVSYAWEAYYRIEHPSLPHECETFMKVEFYDFSGSPIGESEGSRHQEQTHNRWVLDSMRGITPKGTAQIRFVLLAGPNNEDQGVINRIYWDDARILE